MGKKQFCFFQTAETGNRTPDFGVKGSGANHYPRTYGTELDGDQEALNNNGGVITVDGEALKGDAWRFKGKEKALKTKECR